MKGPFRPGTEARARYGDTGRRTYWFGHFQPSGGALRSHGGRRQPRTACILHANSSQAESRAAYPTDYRRRALRQLRLTVIPRVTLAEVVAQFLQKNGCGSRFHHGRHGGHGAWGTEHGAKANECGGQELGVDRRWFVRCVATEAVLEVRIMSVAGATEGHMVASFGGTQPLLRAPGRFVITQSTNGLRACRLNGQVEAA